MTKFKKLKTFNILIFALAPLLLIAMVATVTLAAMTAGGYGQNTIQIGRIGTVTCTATTGSVYPGGTFTIGLTLDYQGVAGSQNINAVTIDPTTLNVSKITVSSPSNSWDIVGTWDSGNKKFGEFLTNVQLNNGSTITLAKGTPQTVNLTFKVRDGMDSGSNSTSTTPNNYLVNSATKMVIAFSVNVEASGTTFS